MTLALFIIGPLVCVAAGVSVRHAAFDRTLPTLVELIGAVLLLAVVLTHFTEQLYLLPAMAGDFPTSPGHYIDLVSAIGGLTFFPAGYFWRRSRRARHASEPSTR